MSRDRGDWIPWYCEDSPGWLELSLAARGAAEGIARKMGPRRGELHLGSRGLRGLATLLRCSWEELEPAIRELTTGDHPRFLVTEDERVLIDPEHDQRRRPTSRERMAKFREKAKSADGVSREPAPLPAPSPRSEDQIRSEENRGDVTCVTVTSVTSRDVTAVTGDPPPWFVGVAERVMGDTGETFGVPEAWIRYSGHRRNKGAPVNANDASYWLGTVMVPEARRERQAKRDREQARREKYEPPKPPPVTPEQSKRFAAELAARVLGKRAAGGER